MRRIFAGSGRFRNVSLVLFVLFTVFFSRSAQAADSGGWTAVAVARFGNVDAVDADDGDLAAFFKGIRNDGRFIPPLRTLLGPEIRNPTFYGLTLEAWLECAIMVPAGPGKLEPLWIFPVDNRDEYVMHLAAQGLTEHEGMDGMTMLREVDSDGSTRMWYLEWLPGNVAVFGSSRDGVIAVRQLYAENSASRGLLAGAGGRYVEPDVMVRLRPSRLAAWQDSEPGSYWWRETVDRLTRDLLRHWQPNLARARFVRALADEAANWPRGLDTVDCSVWFEAEGVEWRLRASGAVAVPRRGGLELFRRIPERTALAYAVPVTPDSFARFGDTVGDLVLGAAGGVMAQDARRVGSDLFDTLRQAGPREALLAWVPPPSHRPELGAARLLGVEWEQPEIAERALTALISGAGADSLLANAFAQLGLEIAVRPDDMDPSVFDIEVYPHGERDGGPLYHALFSYRRRDHIAVLVVGAGRADATERRAVTAYRSSLASGVLDASGPGEADVREAFTRMGPGGAGILGVLDPVRFVQMSLVEMADWRQRSPDQEEPLSTRLAREMLEYDAGGAWNWCGTADATGWDFNGGIQWGSLTRLSAALGVTEVIGVD